MANKTPINKFVKNVVQKFSKLGAAGGNMLLPHTRFRKIDKVNQRRKNQCAKKINLQNMQNMRRRQSKERA